MKAEFLRTVSLDKIFRHSPSLISVRVFVEAFFAVRIGDPQIDVRVVRYADISAISAHPALKIRSFAYFAVNPCSLR